MSVSTVTEITAGVLQLNLLQRQASVEAKPEVQAAILQAQRIHPENEALQCEETVNILWKGYGLLDSHPSLALEYCLSTLMQQNRPLAYLTAGNIAYELALTMPQGTARALALTDARQHLERIAPEEIHLDYLFQYHHVLCHVYEELGQMDKACSRFMTMHPASQESIQVNTTGIPTPVDALTQILGEIPGFTVEQGATTKLTVQLHILSYDLPECALTEAETRVQRAPQDPLLQADLARLYTIHHLFQKAIIAYQAAAKLTRDPKKREELGWEVERVENNAKAPRLKTALARRNIAIYHSDALAHGSDLATFLRCLSHLEQGYVDWELNTNSIIPHISTPHGLLQLAEVEKQYQPSSYVELLYAQLHAHFPLQNAVVPKNLIEALHLVYGSLRVKVTPGAHFVATHIFTELAELQRMPCCVRFCTAAAAIHTRAQH